MCLCVFVCVFVCVPSWSLSPFLWSITNAKAYSTGLMQYTVVTSCQKDKKVVMLVAGHDMGNMAIVVHQLVLETTAHSSLEPPFLCVDTVPSAAL